MASRFYTPFSRILKGDVAGHDFHGNQWSSGMTGTTPDGRSYKELEAQAKELSSKLGYGDKFAENLVRVCADSTTLKKYAEINEAGRNQLKVANLIFDRIGNNNPPKVVSPTEFDSAKSDVPTLYTGISDHRSPASDKISDFAYGQGTKVGAGAFGRAWYATTDKSGAEYYARQWSDAGKTVGGVMSIKLQSGARVMDYNDAIKTVRAADTRPGAGVLDDIDKVTEMISAGKPELEGIAHTVAQAILAGDENIALAMMGVDALTTNINENGEKYVMLLNRSKLLVSSQYEKTDEQGTALVAIPAKPENVIKGDKPEHEFHGNQWILGKGDHANSSVMENGILSDLKSLFGEPSKHILGMRRVFSDQYAPQAKALVSRTIVAEMNKTLDANPDMDKRLCGVGSGDGEPNIDFLRPEDRWVLAKDNYVTYVGNTKEGPKINATEDENNILLSGDDPRVHEALRQMGVSKIVSQWAETAGDSDKVSLAIQQAARDEFGLTNTAYMDLSQETRGQTYNEYRDNGDIYRAFLRAQYNATQKFFAERGIKTVDAYRGMSFEDEGLQETPDWVTPLLKTEALNQSADVPLRPLSSFSYEEQTAIDFSKDNIYAKYALVQRVKIPVEQVLSCALTGIGCLSEKELVVLGGTIPSKIDISVKRNEDESDDLYKGVKPTIIKGDSVGHEFHGNQYEQVEGEIKPEAQKLPDGWRLSSQDEKTYTITSDRGNSAIFNKGAVPYKIGTMGFAGNEKDLMEDGKKEIWTPENPIAVSALRSLDAHAMGKKLDFATSAGEQLSRYVASTNPNDTSVIKIGKLSTINDGTVGKEPPSTTGITADEKVWGCATVFNDKATIMGVSITHELGHIDFTDKGLTVKDIQWALRKTADDLGIEKMPNWDRLEANFLKKVSSNYEKQGKEVPTDLLATKLGRGSAPQSDTGRRWLQSVGATKYGSSRLQECYAECYAIWHTPNFTVTPLVANMASMAGWGERPKGSA